MKKRNVAASATAIVLAVALLFGGTFAYLTASSSEVVNEFEKNHNDVELTEGTEDDDYEIVPGTSQEKNPIITATYTLDSYVFVEVTDATYDLVTWYIENGWTYLTKTTEDGVTTYVYYQLLTYDGDGEEQETTLHVLKGDTVYYDSDITNEDMDAVTADDIYLSFQAYIVQAQLSDDADPADPLTAYGVAKTGASTYIVGATYVALDANATDDSGDPITLATQLTTAISAATDGETLVIVLPEETATDTGSIAVTTTALTSALATQADDGSEIAANIVIDMNDRTLELKDEDGATTSYAVSVVNGDSLTLSNGTVVESSGLTAASTLFYVASGSSLTLDNVTVKETDATVVWVNQQASEVNIVDSSIETTGVYCVATNAATTDNYGVTINIENSVLTATDKSDNDQCAVCINVPGTLNISNSTITGGRQGVVVRAGTANITDSTITTTNAYTGDNRTTRQSSTWGSGNEVAIAALVVGNYTSTAYDDEATVTLNNVTLNVGTATETAGVANAPQIFAASYTEGTYSSTTTVNIIADEGTYSIDSTTMNSGTTVINYASYYVEGATYVAVSGADSSTVASSLISAISAADDDETTVLVLPADLTEAVSVAVDTLNSTIDSDSDIVIDLNGNELVLSGTSSAVIDSDAEVTIANGTLDKSDMSNVGNYAVMLYSNATLTLDNVEYEGGAIGIASSDSSYATLNITDSTITSIGYYAVATNATNPVPEGVTINIENSTLTAVLAGSDPETAGILFNIPGTLNISNSTIIGGSQGIIMRGGTANISDSAIVASMTGYDSDATSAFSTTTSYLNGSKNWDSGNGLPAAALVVGNHSGSAYAYETTVMLNNVTLTVKEGTSTVPAIYAASCNGYAASITGANDTDTLLAYVGTTSGDSVTVNNNSVAETITTMTTVGALASE